VRLWIGALMGPVFAAGGIAWVLATGWSGGIAALREPIAFGLAIAALAGLVAGVVFAWWLDRGVVARVRRITASARAGEASALHDPFSASGWGELSDLRNHVTSLITHYRHAARSADQLQQLERQIDVTRQTVQHWIETERWATLPHSGSAMQGLAEALNQGFRRHSDVNEQNQEAARQVQTGIAAAVVEARETAEQSERGFVEVTSLLTTVRELERLGGELHQTLAARPAPAPVDPDARAPGLSDAGARAVSRDWLEPVSQAFRDLVDTASVSVEELAAGLARVQELSDHVHVLGNRATLIALNALIAARRGEPEVAAASADELKLLAREARVATDRVRQLADETGVQVRSAGERMKRARERVAEFSERLEIAKLTPPRPVASAPVTVAALGPDTLRALDRVREMITDAARKAERLSAAGERASRAADRLVRRLDEDLRDVEGLVVRLLPPANGAATTRLQGEVRRFDVIGPEGRMPAPEPGAGRRSIQEDRP
jgi:methyl-accepting chemotaxis protein